MFFHGWLVGFVLLFTPQWAAAKTREIYAVNSTWSSSYTENTTACDGWGYVETKVEGKGFEQIFTGIRAQWFYVESTDGAAVEVYQDNVFISTKTTYGPTSQLATCKYVVYDTGNLTMGTHNITMFHAGIDVTSSSPEIPALRSIGVVIYDLTEDTTTTATSAGRTTAAGPLATGTSGGSASTAIPKADTDSKSVSPGIIVGGVVGGIVAFAAMGGIIFLCFRRKRPSKSHPPTYVPPAMASRAVPQPPAPSYGVAPPQQAYHNASGDPFSPNSNQQYPAYAAHPQAAYNTNYAAQPYSPVPPTATTGSSHDAWTRPEAMNPYNYNQMNGGQTPQMSNHTVASTTPLTYR